MALPPSAGGAAGGMMPPDAMSGGMGGGMGGAPPPPAGGGDDSGAVIVTISKTGDGSYMVYAGDEPDADSGDMSADDANAMGAAGGAPAPAGGGMGGGAAGQPASSIGEALKLAMDIMQADKGSEGAPGNSDDQLSAGYSSDKNPTPSSGMKQKY